MLVVQHTTGEKVFADGLWVFKSKDENNVIVGIDLGNASHRVDKVAIDEFGDLHITNENVGGMWSSVTGLNSTLVDELGYNGYRLLVKDKNEAIKIINDASKGIFNIPNRM